MKRLRKRITISALAGLPLILAGLYFLHASRIRLHDPRLILLWSEEVGDAFDLYIDLPEGYCTADSNYSVVFYMDANLKMGKEIRRQIHLPANTGKWQRVIFVGVGHLGYYRQLRRRDFIPPQLMEGIPQPVARKYFGHADRFYRFISKELIPHIRKLHPNNGNYTFVGHSFSGLFALYCLFQPDSPFRHYYAISPSLWANNRCIFDYEKKYYTNATLPPATVYHSCGSAEWVNKVLYSSRDMHDTLKRHYPGLTYTYRELPGKSHNGTVPVAIAELMARLQHP